MSLGFYFDMTRCIGCRACQVACKDRNDLPIGMLFRYVKTYETGSFPKVGIYNYSGSCNHCETPACVTVCPVGAMYKAEDGTVIHDDDMCIGCQACVRICPYGVPQYDEVRKITRKCDACASLRAKGENPACVDACPNRALDFGDVDELKAKYGPDLVHDIAVLPDSGMTGANTQIKAKTNALDEDFREIRL